MHPHDRTGTEKLADLKNLPPTAHFDRFVDEGVTAPGSATQKEMVMNRTPTGPLNKMALLLTVALALISAAFPGCAPSKDPTSPRPRD